MGRRRIRSTGRLEVRGGYHDGGEVEDLGTTFCYVDRAGEAHDLPGPGRVLHHFHAGAMQVAFMCECGGILLERVGCPLCGRDNGAT